MSLDVLTLPAVIAALVAGFGVGFVLLAEVIQGDRYGTATAPAGSFGLLIAVLAALVVGIFYASQIASAILDGDEQWPRAASRYALFVVFAAALGAGTWAGLHREWRHR